MPFGIPYQPQFSNLLAGCAALQQQYAVHRCEKTLYFSVAEVMIATAGMFLEVSKGATCDTSRLQGPQQSVDSQSARLARLLNVASIWEGGKGGPVEGAGVN